MLVNGQKRWVAISTGFSIGFSRSESKLLQAGCMISVAVSLYPSLDSEPEYKTWSGHSRKLPNG